MAADAPADTPVTVTEAAALRVVKGALAASFAGGIVGSVLGVARAQPATLLATQGFSNAFVFAFPFFALREYALSPILEPGQQDTSLPIDRSHRLISTAVSASVAGGGLAWYFRGPKKLVPGITTFGILCTALQIVGNEARVQRFNYLAKREAPLISDIASTEVSVPVAPRNTDREITPPASSGEVVSATLESPQEPSKPSWWRRSLLSLVSLSPVRKVSDEEYEKILQTQKADIKRQLADLDEQIARQDSETK